MNFDSIAVFVKVVEAGGFSAAARLLNMPKTTVSAKVAALEKSLDINLIQRTTRKLRVTEAGQTYFHHCANAVREIELGDAVLQLAQSRPCGLLKITAPVDIGHTVLPRIARAFLEKYPEVRIEMVISNRVVDLVGEGFDLAIRAGTLKDSSLIAKRFFDVQSTLCASPTYLEKAGKITHPQQLSKARFVAPTDSKMIYLKKGNLENEIAINSSVTVDDLGTIKALTLLDEGIGALPFFLAIEAIEAGTLVQVLPTWTLRSTGAFYFVYTGQKYSSPKVQAFIETAIDVFGFCRKT